VSDATTKRAEETITAEFDRAGCVAAWHIVDLGSSAEIGVQPDAPVVMASVFKVLIALEFYAQAEAGVLDPARIVTLDPDAHTAGPAGISNFEDPVCISLRDLCRMMMTISDNTATDALLQVVGLDRVNTRARSCGCMSTVVESNLRDLFDGIAADIGFSSHAELIEARSGALGPGARRQSWDTARTAACAALDPVRTTRSTPRDMTRLLSAIWKNEAAPPASCAKVRKVMAQQVSTRLGRALPDGASLAAKTGTLTGWIRNEIGVITHADGRAFAAAFFTRAHKFLNGGAAIQVEMAHSAAAAISALRSAAT
jgi:beta-lactamase class A